MATMWYYRTSVGDEAGPLSAHQIQTLAEVGLIGPTTEVKKRSDGRWVLAKKVQGLLDEAKWYYRNDAGEEGGPVSARQLQMLAEVGLIGPATEIKKRANGRWVPADKVRGLLNASTPIETLTSDELTPTSDEPAPTPPAQPAVERTPSPPGPSEPPVAQTQSPPTGARPNETAGRPEPTVWGTHPNPWEPAPTPTRSPLALVGAGSVGTLVVIGFLALVFGDGATSPTAEWPGDGPIPRTTERASEWEEPPAELPAPESSKLLVDAKRLLLDRLSDVGGGPEANVSAGIELLMRHLARPDAANRTEAALLLDQARTALSDDKAVQLLLAVSDFDRTELAGKTGGFGRTDLLAVPKSRADALCPGFSERFKTEFAEGGHETRVFITGQSYPGGRSHSSLETAFYETLKKNADRATRQVAARRAAAREERAKRRDEKERQAVLQNGTDEFKRVVETPEKYAHGHYSFDGLFGSRLGNLRRQTESMSYSVAFSCQNKSVPTVTRPVKDRLSFVVSDDLGTKLLDLQDGECPARVYCRIRYADPDADAFPQAVIYKIDFYDDNTFKGAPKFTVE